MSSIDNEVLAMFNGLNASCQGKLLDYLGELVDQQPVRQWEERSE
jgi:hypothetical protein